MRRTGNRSSQFLREKAIRNASTMAKLEDLQPGIAVSGILPQCQVVVVSARAFGSEAVELTYKDPGGKLASEIVFRADEARLEVGNAQQPWTFTGDGALFRLLAEAHRIRLAHLFDPLLAVHTSVVDPLPHQITAVYETMLTRQPLRFLLADDPGSGKTIMTGLLMKELLARGDLQRCLVVCPGALAEQWQDELSQRFQLHFEILTNDQLESARSGNWFLEHDLVIARLDKLSRDESVQAKLAAPGCGWDLVVCDEAHKLSATYFGREVKYTKRYRLGQLLSSVTRHFLLLTATPHNGKDEDFQLFMALLDPERFEGRFNVSVERADVSDLMRRMVKEQLVKFDSTPLFPERRAATVAYKLSEEEIHLYEAVTRYVREEFNRAENLGNRKRSGTVGFALTILQRRLASSPEAIYQSLRHRRERLEGRLRELERAGSDAGLGSSSPLLDEEDIDDFEEAGEVEAIEREILDQATAARTVAELAKEIGTLRQLEAQAAQVRRSGEDRKWRELASLLGALLTPSLSYERTSPGSVRQKLVIFTEHRDTLVYLFERVSAWLGKPGSAVAIHGGVRREERQRIQEAFRNDPDVSVLIATDAAGEGINLQRAHLMVNYDLPWNPNRLEQRFGRIHRIGQTEVCHLWNLAATDTREGEVYERLLEKIQEAQRRLQGRIFDVLGRIVFDGRPLRELLVEAIRYGELPETRARLLRVVENAFDPGTIQSLLEEKVLVHDVMDSSRVRRIREDMERAEARRLQPHYIESFFLEAFRYLGGSVRPREPRRYEITHVPVGIRAHSRMLRPGEPVVQRYERITFEKERMHAPGRPPAGFVCPGHPLLDTTLSMVLERHRDLLRRGAVLIDERDGGEEPRVLWFIEHGIQDASTARSGERRLVSKQMLYVEMDRTGTTRQLHYAPYLDYRSLDDLTVIKPLTVDVLTALPSCAWVTQHVEEKARGYAIQHVVPGHLEAVRTRTVAHLAKVEAAVKERLSREIGYWDRRAIELEEGERAGAPNARLNSQEARRRADELQVRMERRLAQLEREKQLSPLPPVVVGGALVIPVGLLRKLGYVDGQGSSADLQIAAQRAREAVMAAERELGFDPRDVEHEKLGYDIESRVPAQGRLRFIEVKSRAIDADTVTVTRNEILYSLNNPDNYILAIVQPDGGSPVVRYVRQPFHKEPDFGAASVNYLLKELLARSTPPS